MSVVAVPVAWPRACDFACHSAACRPPTSGGTGGSGVGAPSAKAIPGFYKYWWRLNGGSQALTDAAGEKLGIEGYGSDGADKGTRDAAESLLLAIGSQPVGAGRWHLPGLVWGGTRCVGGIRDLSYPRLVMWCRSR